MVENVEFESQLKEVRLHLYKKYEDKNMSIITCVYEISSLLQQL